MPLCADAAFPVWVMSSALALFSHNSVQHNGDGLITALRCPSRVAFSHASVQQVRSPGQPYMLARSWATHRLQGQATDTLCCSEPCCVVRAVLLLFRHVPRNQLSLPHALSYLMHIGLIFRYRPVPTGATLCRCVSAIFLVLTTVPCYSRQCSHDDPPSPLAAPQME